MVIIDIETGLVFNEFNLETQLNEFFIHKENYWLTYNGRSIYFYDIYGRQKEMKIDEDQALPDLRLMGLQDNQLTFLDFKHTQLIVYCEIPLFFTFALE